MTATRWPDIVEALVDAMRARPGYRAPGADSHDGAGVVVLDGPEVELTEAGTPVALIVGGTIESRDIDDLGEAGQVVVTVGGLQRDDSGDIVCQVIAQAGRLELDEPGWTEPRSTIRTVRRAAFAVVDDVDAVLKADPTLGLPMPTQVNLAATRMQPRQWQTESGFVCSVKFRVSFVTRV